MVTERDNEKLKEIEELAREVMGLARDTVLVQMRFLSTAMGRLTMTPDFGIGGVMTEGTHIYYDPVFILEQYSAEKNFPARVYLHTLLHCIFSHLFGYDKLEKEYWNMAVDLAVEDAILAMDLPGFALNRDDEQRRFLQRLKKLVPVLTAERLYRHFRINGASRDYAAQIVRLFTMDRHDSWQVKIIQEKTEVDWRKLSERVKADLKSFSKGRTGDESLEENLSEATREHYDYSDILRQFAVLGEDMQPSNDEFDVIFYTYGMERYGNMPLIEPLEFREEKKVREFVIVLDTSASCRGRIVQAFLRKTYSILMASENFFSSVNIHILQCDNEVRRDTRIGSPEEFELFLQEGKLTGFGSTDFRPAFQYVDELLQKQEFDNLKGLIYFTDGYGIYPDAMPPYNVIFTFLNEDDHRPPIPIWAIQAVIEEEELEKQDEY